MTDLTLAAARQQERAYGSLISESDRPMFHLTPFCGWLNDPNGFSYYNNEYHLFYQYNPYNSRWDTMHWGHAVSSDLLRWKHLPAVLAPDSPLDEGGCYSGSAVTLPDGRQLLMYTGLRRPIRSREIEEAERTGEPFIQIQNLAIGDGCDYVKYSKNPVIDSDTLPPQARMTHFRDPKILRCGDGTYLALIANMKEDGLGQVLMYRSRDCFTWKYWKPLIQNDGRFGRMWECPDFFELDGQWMFMVSPMDMKPVGLEFHNGCGSLLLTGSFDEKTGTFSPAFHQAIDYGIDFYAAQTILTPDGRRVMTAWMNNWDTCLKRDERVPWAGQMTIPRELSFRDGRLWQQPVRELEQYYTNIISYKKVPVSDEISLYGVEGRTIDLEVTVRPAPGEPLYRKFAIWFAMDQENHSAVRFNPDDGTVKIDRKHAGSRKAIVHQRRCLVPESMDGNIRLRIILDRNSFEVFINDGRYVMSATIPTPLSADRISFRTEGKAVIDVTKREIRIS